MNAFENCQHIEARARGLILPWLNARYSAVFDFARRDDTAMQMQWAGIDLLLVKEPAGPSSRDSVTVELKAEQRTTGNLFLETWSNRKTQRPGWIRSSKAVGLLYLFLDTETLYVAHMGKLQEWATANLSRFPEKMQAKHQQENETVGHIVPVTRLSHEAGLRRFYIRANRREAA